jgi:hypothetical protein
VVVAVVVVMEAVVYRQVRSSQVNSCLFVKQVKSRKSLSNFFVWNGPSWLACAAFVRALRFLTLARNVG